MSESHGMKKTVLVLFGGVSSEHEVSLRSAATVMRGIPGDRYRVLVVGITGEGRWLLFRGDPGEVESGAWEQGDTAPAVLSPDRSHGGLLLGDGTVESVDVIFPVLHGKNGEDGTLQGLLDLCGIPYVGCGVLSSALCMDKEVAHTVLCAAGLPKTKLIALGQGDTRDLASLEKRLGEELGYPMFVKPANAGSSVGVTKVKDAAGLEPALRLAFAHDHKVVVEQLMTGQEVECAVMGNEEPVASQVVGEIVPPDGVYDYASKYLNDSAGLYIPARIPEGPAAELRRLAVKAYRAAGCRGLARVDFFVREDGGVVLNEINTLPGFTSISMFPKLFEASGVCLEELCDRLIRYALER